MSNEEKKESVNQKGLFNIGRIEGDASGNFIGKGVITINRSSLPHSSADDQAKLEDLLKQLEAALEKVPIEKKEEAETVAEYAEELVGEASKEKPKKPRLTISGEGLKKAAQNLAGVAPQVGLIAGQIIANVMKGLGMGV